MHGIPVIAGNLRDRLRALVGSGFGTLTVHVNGWPFLLANQPALGRHRDLADVERIDGSNEGRRA